MQRTIEIHRVQFAIISPAQELVESTTAGVHKTSCMLLPLAPCLKCQAVDLLAARNSSSFWGAKSVHPVRRAICACMWLAALGRPPRLGANGAAKAPLTNTWTFRSVSGFRENNTCIKCWPFVFTSSPRSLQTSCGSGRTRHEHATGHRLFMLDPWSPGSSWLLSWADYISKGLLRAWALCAG